MSDALEGAVCGVDGCTPTPLDYFGPASGAKTTLAIEVISDAICPWCWVAKRRLESALAALAPDITATTPLFRRAIRSDDCVYCSALSSGIVEWFLFPRIYFCRSHPNLERVHEIVCGLQKYGSPFVICFQAGRCSCSRNAEKECAMLAFVQLDAGQSGIRATYRLTLGLFIPRLASMVDVILSRLI